jgi:CMP-N-acetylneuraminic acid synthetase
MNDTHRNMLAIIPARGGSKGLPKKNIRVLHGKPLIVHTIQAALQSRFISRTLVSTDDPDIVGVSKKSGAEVMMRPSELATDTASTIDVVLYCLSLLEEQGWQPDCVILLQPTSPLRTVHDIDDSIALLGEEKVDSVISVQENEHPPYWSCIIEDHFLKPAFGDQYFRLRRQEIPTTYAPNGAIYIATPEYLKQHRIFYGERTLPFVMPRERSVDIDTEMDFLLAEAIMNKRHGKRS